MLRRRARPERWALVEKRWRAADADGKAGSRLQREAEFFHANVREPGEPKLCAYCEAELGVSSPATIDHFLPRALCARLGLRELELSWWNLFPACALCNSTFKLEHWSAWLLRPDTEPVEDLVDVDVLTGALVARFGLSPVDRRRVRKTIRLLGLNSSERKAARRRVLGRLERGVDGEAEALATQGPYRFLARFAR